ncbi:Serine/threonine protein kinase [Streptosporangium subroseum]|uniref:Serine/threonine protein kinase n=1 Tax=Streptosporangium subroseum TaxID=106412 RepID=A0A239BJS8_9ACTN|nr:serine/threonine-protein kinase [Streptosporangium subroseum]SNS08477.1 Serine/threonine protein kinase [Streptosporangium subroseum]
MLPLLMGDPREIGSYRIVGRLGAGGMGVVYAGVDAAGRRVAVKLVHEALSINLEFRRRFSREISVLGGVEGACVARVLSSDPGTERPWLATEYIAGPTLEEHLRTEEPLAGDALYGLAAGLAEALVAMHAAGVVHRDLKPSNVILSSEGPRLIDFGIAKVLDGTAMTHTGTLIGSPGWISPEEYGEGPSGTPADVYGWAMLVLFAVTGEAPYGTGRPEVLAYRVREEMPETGAVPEELRELVGRALAKDPAERPVAAEVLAAVTETWRGRAGEQEEPGADVTSLIQRTWVLSRAEVPDWPEAAGPMTAQAATALMVEGATAAGPAGSPPVPETGLVVSTSAGVATSPHSLPALPETGPRVGAFERPGPSWVHAYIATAVGVTLIAVTAIVAVAATSSSERSTTVIAAQATPAQTTPVPTASPTLPTSSSSPTPTVSKKSKKAPRFKGKVVSFRGIKMTLPKDWRLLRVREDLACIESPNAQGSSGAWNFACRPDAMIIRTGAGADRWPGSSIDDPVGGWSLGNPMPCLAGGGVRRDWSGTYGRDFGEYAFYVEAYDDGSSLIRSSLAKMADGRKAAYREWWVRCANDDHYTTKIWHLPQSRVSLFVLSARPEDTTGYRQIIASTNLLGYKYAAPL